MCFNSSLNLALTHTNMKRLEIYPTMRRILIHAAIELRGPCSYNFRSITFLSKSETSESPHLKGEKRIENNVRRRLLGGRNKTRKHVSLVSAFFLILT